MSVRLQKFMNSEGWHLKRKTPGKMNAAWCYFCDVRTDYPLFWVENTRRDTIYCCLECADD